MMNHELDLVVTVSESALFQQVAGEAIILNMQTEHYFGLNGVATRAWQLIQEHGNLSAVFETLGHEYDVAPTKLTQDLLRLVQDLQEAGLVTIET